MIPPLRFFTLALCSLVLLGSCCFAQDKPNLLPEVRIAAGNSWGSGTVFYVDEQSNAFVLTNHHVAGRRGSRCGVDFWADGKMYPSIPAIVVHSQIGGTVDVAVVRVAAADLPGVPEFLPLANPGSAIAADTPVTSRGSPGGTWQTQFIGRVFRADQSTMQFHPRPGGGRSGSSVLAEKRIVGLLTWSSGRPSSEEHGTDGRGYRSGFGIAQQIDVVWGVLRGNTAASGELPRDYHPLLWKPTLPVLDPDEIQDRPIPSQVESGVPRADQEFRFTPDDQDALLRRRRGEDPQFPNLPGSRPEAPPRVSRPLLYGIGQALGRLIGWAVLLAVVVVVAYVVARRKGWLAIALLALPTVACAQDSELATLAEKWNREVVTSGNDWGSYANAHAGHKEDQGPLVTLISIPGCRPCEELKSQLKALDRLGYFNGSHTSIVDAQADPNLARALAGDMFGRGYPLLVVQVPENSQVKIHRRMGLFPDASAVAKRLADQETNPGLRWQPHDLMTIEEYLIAVGVR